MDAMARKSSRRGSACRCDTSGRGSEPEACGEPLGPTEPDERTPEEPSAKPAKSYEFRYSGPSKRLDVYLSEQLPDLSRSYIQKLIESGCVAFEATKKDPKPSSKLLPGAVIRVEIPPPRKLNLDPVDIPIRVIYEDDHVAVIDKPGDLAVHPSLHQASNTLVNALLFHLRSLSSIAGVERPGIVHRLDKETSGVLVVAKNDFAHRALARQFKERLVHKTYVAIVRGEPADWEGRVELRLGRSYTHSKKQIVRTDGTGREAVTDYRVLEKYKGYALLEVYPRTGRTHQIRVHLLSQRLPIACDKLYGREKRIYLSELKGEPRAEGEVPLIERQALHAARIALIHPATREEMVFSAGLHEDMLRLLRALERHRALGR